MERVVFFDGVCNFCSFWVKFVIRRDPAGKFKFAPLRNLAHRFIANNRYRWFGKEKSCFVPTPEIRSRFL